MWSIRGDVPLARSLVFMVLSIVHPSYQNKFYLSTGFFGLAGERKSACPFGVREQAPALVRSGLPPLFQDGGKPPHSKIKTGAGEPARNACRQTGSLESRCAAAARQGSDLASSPALPDPAARQRLLGRADGDGALLGSSDDHLALLQHRFPAAVPDRAQPALTAPSATARAGAGGTAAHLLRALHRRLHGRPRHAPGPRSLPHLVFPARHPGE